MIVSRNPYNKNLFDKMLSYNHPSNQIFLFRTLLLHTKLVNVSGWAQGQLLT